VRAEVRRNNVYPSMDGGEALERACRGGRLIVTHQGGSDSVYSFFDVSGFKAGFGCQ
jgi:hypothetical protein